MNEGKNRSSTALIYAHLIQLFLSISVIQIWVHCLSTKYFELLSKKKMSSDADLNKNKWEWKWKWKSLLFIPQLFYYLKNVFTFTLFSSRLSLCLFYFLSFVFTMCVRYFNCSSFVVERQCTKKKNRKNENDLFCACVEFIYLHIQYSM